MYTKFTRYTVSPEKKEEFLDIQQEISDVVLNSMGGRMQFMRSLTDDSHWIAMQQVESRDLYERRSGEVRELLHEAGLPQRLGDLLLADPEEDFLSEYYMFMEMVAEE